MGKTGLGKWAGTRFSAFTLAELIVVITVLAILATVGFLALSWYSQDAKDAAISANVRSVYSAISSESVATGNSPRYYVTHNSEASLSWAFAMLDGTSAVLTGGKWDEAGTNYSAGNPDYAKLRLNPEKFRTAKRVEYVREASAAYGAEFYDKRYLSVWAADLWTVSNGKKRLVSFIQVAGISPGTWKASVSGNFPSNASKSGSIAGLIDDPLSDSSTGAIVDGNAVGLPTWESTPTRTGSCVGLPATNAVWNSTWSIIQTWNGNEWAPSFSGSYDSVESTVSCVFKCVTGYMWNAQTSSCQPLAYSKIVSGTNHSCGLTGAGWVRCWGYNGHGELWNNTTTDSGWPVDVVGLSSWVTDITAGFYHTCALLDTGTAKCWGYNAYAELGDGTTSTRTKPVDVAGLAWITKITAGTYFTCAIVGGWAKCWGRNDFWGVWNSSTGTSVPAATDVTWLTSGVADISAGYFYACALTTSGWMKCWGYNGHGELGIWSVTDAYSPVDVTGLTSGVASISAKIYSTCAVTTAWALKCWGYNNYGQVWDGTTSTRTSPVAVSWMSSWVATPYAGYFHNCAVTTAWALKCWGYNAYGQLGNGTVTNSSVTPVDVTGFTSWTTAVSMGQYFGCGMKADGIPKCWGYDSYKQLGIGNAAFLKNSVDVTGLTSGVASVSAGTYGTCTVTTSGWVKCWGQNTYGQIGDGTTLDKAAPTLATWLSSGIASVSAGQYSTCAVTTTGGAKCWGYNKYGGLWDGTATARYSPVIPTWLSSGVAQISVGVYSTCAVTTSGGAKCWGYNPNGGIWDGTVNNALNPTDVDWLASWVAKIWVGQYFACALTTSGGVKCWGLWTSGQLGNGTNVSSTIPVDVVGLSSGVTDIAVGNYAACAITDAGWVKCWGNNGYWAVWNGTNVHAYSPADVVGLTSGVTKVSGWAHSACALVGGAVKCWGFNRSSQLGDGTVTHSYAPVNASVLPAGITDVSVGYYGACAVTSGGGVKCWGYDSFWQSGIGADLYKSTPVNVAQ